MFYVALADVRAALEAHKALVALAARRVLSMWRSAPS
jgi:hypothetical protein